MVGLGRFQTELGEDARDVFLDGPSVTTRRRAIPVREPSAMSARTSCSRGVSPSLRVPARAGEELGDHLGVERGSAARDALERIQVAHVGHALLE